MELPHSKLRQAYTDDIKVAEATIKDLADGEASPELFDYAQKKLDKLAEHYQDSAEIGSARYKMYELQALLYYFQNRDTEALDFVHAAIKTKGSSYARAERLVQKIEASEKQPKKDDHTMLFFHRSPVAVALLTFFTFNLYSLYWAYKHWRAIRVSTGVRTWPVLSAIFQLFTSYPLFRHIRDSAQKHGDKAFRKAGLAATGYIIMFVMLNAAWRVESRTIEGAVTGLVFIGLLAAGIAAILATVQRAANAHNIAVLGKKHQFKSVFAGEIVFAIVGVIIGIAAIIGTFSLVGTVDIGSLSGEAKNAYSRMESLRKEYDHCSGDLDTRRSSVDTSSEYAVNSYNTDWQACEDTRLELNRTVDTYNKLAGFE